MFESQSDVDSDDSGFGMNLHVFLMFVCAQAQILHNTHSCSLTTGGGNVPTKCKEEDRQLLSSLLKFFFLIQSKINLTMM